MPTEGMRAGIPSPGEVSLRPAEPHYDTATAMLDARGRVIAWSRAAERTQGYRPEEIIGRHVSCLYTPEDIAHGMPERHLQKAVTRGRLASEGWCLRKDGSRFWASVVIVALRETDGSLRGFAQATREVTAQVFSRAALDSLGEQVCVLNSSGTIVLTNEAWELCDRARGMELARGKINDNYLEICRATTGPLRSAAVDALGGITRVLEGGSPHFTLDYACPPASPKLWFRLTGRPLGRPGGGAIIEHSDVTGSAALTRQSTLAEKHCRAMMECFAGAVTVLAADGTIQYQSPGSEGVLGFRPEELAGRRIFELVHPKDTGPLRKVLRECVRYPHRKYQSEYRFRARDGSWRIVASTARGIAPAAPDTVILISRDATRERRTERALASRHDALARRCGELESVVARRFREQDEERRQVAGELSGNLGQRLAAVSLQAAFVPSREDSMGQLRRLQESLAALGRDLRSLADGIYPPTLGHGGLSAALGACCAELHRKEGIHVRYASHGYSGDLPEPVARVLYRVAGDALAHVAGHARNQQARVTLSRTSKGVRLSIRNCGACVPELLISGLRAVLQPVQGSLCIRTLPEGRTEIAARVPHSLINCP